MPGKVVLSKSKFENLISHLVKIEDEKNMLIEEYFPEPTKERSKFSGVLDSYIAKIDFLIKNNISIGENTDNSFPFVIIHCEVDVEDLEMNEILKFRIVSPYNNREINDVSYLSPVGRSLLLKSVGDEVNIDTPGGKLVYKIQSIKLTFL
jgi:transcription elongation factor GreA